MQRNPNPSPALRRRRATSTVAAYALQRHRATAWRKNFDREGTIAGASSTSHSFHPWRWHRAGHLGREFARIRCCSRQGVKREKEDRLVRVFGRQGIKGK